MNIPTLKIGNLEAKFPLIQGGMGIGVSLSRLAAAVANQGGIGIISGAQTGYKEDNFKTNNDQANVTGIQKEIRKARELSPNGIIGINFLQASHNYIELVNTAVKEKVDLIITDIQMPFMNGIDFTRQIRKKDLFTKVIFLTGYNDDINRKQVYCSHKCFCEHRRN